MSQPNKDQILQELVNRINKLRAGLNSLIFVAQSLNDDLNVIAQIVQAVLNQLRETMEMNEELKRELKEIKARGGKKK